MSHSRVLSQVRFHDSEAGSSPSRSELTQAAGALIRHARRNPQLRGELLDFAAALSRELGGIESTSGEGQEDLSAIPPAELPSELIGTRCRLKAEALRWQTRRRELLDDGRREKVADGDARIIGDARELEDCFLWMCKQEFHDLRDAESLARLARCYDAVALAVDLMTLAESVLTESAVEVRTAFLLVGEAQSALRVGIDESGWRKGDPDQAEIFNWLRHETKRRQIYVPHMQLKSPASPDDVEDVIERVEALRQSLCEGAATGKSKDCELKKLRYHAGKLADAPDPRAELQRQHWDGLLGAIQSAVGAGLAADDARLVAAVAPLTDRYPPSLDWSPAATTVFQHAERQAQPASQELAAAAEEE